MRCRWYLTVALTLQQWLSAYWFGARTTGQTETESGCVASSGPACNGICASICGACHRCVVKHCVPKAGKQTTVSRERQKALKATAAYGIQQIYSWQTYTNVDTDTHIWHEMDSGPVVAQEIRGMPCKLCELQCGSYHTQLAGLLCLLLY